ncbi:MAG: type II toxin-antitoxin system PemK/MazF family toxin [Candidatus Vogelbacteria bacterium]|nr:type II toxin-antitoxin system PemK/MazF family toxin [Candidatus Vogelbacteria bacterium]
MPKPGDIILVPFPFTDLSGDKVRPALILASVGSNSIMAMISSTRHGKKWPSDYDILDNDADFAASGLKVSSRIHLGKLATIEAKIILGQLGFLTQKHCQQINKKLARLFGY